MRNVIAFLVALGLVAAIFWLTRSKEKAARQPPATTASGSAAPGTPAAEQPERIDVSRVRRLDKASRQRLGEQIAAARERASTNTSTSGTPSLEAPMTLEDVGPSLQDKLREAIPILAECFAEPGAREATAMMTLLTDPELGTVIDTDTIKDANDQPLDAAIETCLRDTIDSLALPPLGPKGGQLPLKYTFKFD
jgi:hypothetical protein